MAAHFSDVKPHGAMSNSINAWRDGIVSRGVLLDVAGARGAPWLDLNGQVHAEDLNAAEEFGNVRVEEGDIPVVRTGHWERQVAEGWWEPEFSDPDFRGWWAPHAPLAGRTAMKPDLVPARRGLAAEQGFEPRP